eukprot:4979363-Pleurochrysis_carterae.AAC.2
MTYENLWEIMLSSAATQIFISDFMQPTIAHFVDKHRRAFVGSATGRRKPGLGLVKLLMTGVYIGRSRWCSLRFAARLHLRNTAGCKLACESDAQKDTLRAPRASSKSAARHGAHTTMVCIKLKAPRACLLTTAGLHNACVRSRAPVLGKVQPCTRLPASSTLPQEACVCPCLEAARKRAAKH